MVRIRRKIDKDKKMGDVETLVKAFVLNESEVREEHIASNESDFDKSTASKQISLKTTKLDFVLMSYLRAHLLISYPDTLLSLKVTEPTDVDYELYMLSAYRIFLGYV